jgi:hypothetical protein
VNYPATPRRLMVMPEYIAVSPYRRWESEVAQCVVKTPPCSSQNCREMILGCDMKKRRDIGEGEP